jgi:hypothetical protein
MILLLENCSSAAIGRKGRPAVPVVTRRVSDQQVLVFSAASSRLAFTALESPAATLCALAVAA